MPIYVGFNTIDINQPRKLVRPGVDGGVGSNMVSPRTTKKFRLVDTQLVIRDFQNALSIQQGELPGLPTYGTTLWSYVFEPNTEDTRRMISEEIRRVASQDPRIELTDLQVYFLDQGVQIELQMTVNMTSDEVQVGFFLNRYDGSIQRLAQ
jgi:phage baseplate assembly protein W